jgi:hypothetical protein
MTKTDYLLPKFCIGQQDNALRFSPPNPETTFRASNIFRPAVPSPPNHAEIVPLPGDGCVKCTQQTDSDLYATEFTISVSGCSSLTTLKQFLMGKNSFLLPIPISLQDHTPFSDSKTITAKCRNLRLMQRKRIVSKAADTIEKTD